MDYSNNNPYESLIVGHFERLQVVCLLVVSGRPVADIFSREDERMNGEHYCSRNEA